MNNFVLDPPEPTELDKLRAVAAQAKEVRRVQKEYFRTRSQSSLVTSKNAERKLDRMLESL